jgi:hypothetical protein
MRPLENGNFLLTLASTHKLTEVNTSGTVVWSATLTDKPYLAHRLSNGHTLSTSGEDCRVYDISPDGKSMTLVAGSLEKHPSAKLLWFSGFEILANGHYFVANWNGHGMEGKGPHALEFDSNNNIVWQWDDPVAASTVTNILTFEIGTTGLELHRQYYFRRPAVYEGVRFDAGKSVLGTLGPARIEIGSQGFLANGSLATGLIPEGRRSDFRESRE